MDTLNFKEVEFPMNMHVAECFSVMYDVQVQPMGGALFKVRILILSRFNLD